MAFFQQEEVLVVELVQVEALLSRQCVAGRHREHERLVEQRLDVQLVVMQRQGEDPGVQPSFPQPRQDGVGLLLDQQQLEPRKALPDTREDVRQQVGCERGKHAEPHAAGFGVLAAPRDLGHLLDFRDHPAGALGDVQADRRQHHPAWGPLHQRYTKLFLELLHLRGQRRLADEACLRRPAEMLVVGEGHEVLEIAQVQASLLPVGRDARKVPAPARMPVPWALVRPRPSRPGPSCGSGGRRR